MNFTKKITLAALLKAAAGRRLTVRYNAGARSFFGITPRTAAKNIPAADLATIAEIMAAGMKRAPLSSMLATVPDPAEVYPGTKKACRAIRCRLDFSDGKAVTPVEKTWYPAGAVLFGSTDGRGILAAIPQRVGGFRVLVLEISDGIPADVAAALKAGKAAPIEKAAQVQNPAPILAAKTAETVRRVTVNTAKAPADGGPYNPFTGSVYTGKNVGRLMKTVMECGGLETRFMTFPEVAYCGYRLRKGAKATYIYRIIDRAAGGDVDDVDNIETAVKARRVKKIALFSVVDVVDFPAAGVPIVATIPERSDETKDGKRKAAPRKTAARKAAPKKAATKRRAVSFLVTIKKPAAVAAPAAEKAAAPAAVAAPAPVQDQAAFDAIPLF